MIRLAINFISDIFNKRTILYELAKRDFKQKYQGTYLGVFWMLLQPLLYISVLTMVFTYGLRAGSSEEMPFILYFIPGLIVWMYFSENLNSCTNVVKAYGFLVKKVDFRLSMLPIVKIISSIIPHIFLLLFILGISWNMGYPPSLYVIQIIYYQLALAILLIGLSWITSSTSLFIPDVAKFVSLVIQFGFWLTPIIWNISNIPPKYQWIFKLNPIVYIIEGYRDSIIRHQWFWEKPIEFFIYWLTTFIFVVIGIIVFRKLRPHFAEVI